jgi:hypothetical protein
MGERISIAVKQMEYYYQGKDKIGLDLGANGKEWSWKAELPDHLPGSTPGPRTWWKSW